MTKILVADDEADLETLIKQKFRKQIREHQYEFVFALNGKEALEKIQQQLATQQKRSEQLENELREVHQQLTIEKLRLLRVLTGHTGPVTGVAISPDGQNLGHLPPAQRPTRLTRAHRDRSKNSPRP